VPMAVPLLLPSGHGDRLLAARYSWVSAHTHRFITSFETYSTSMRSPDEQCKTKSEFDPGVFWGKKLNLRPASPLQTRYP
jgi:hypothetical protein